MTLKLKSKKLSSLNNSLVTILSAISRIISDFIYLFNKYWAKPEHGSEHKTFPETHDKFAYTHSQFLLNTESCRLFL